MVIGSNKGVVVWPPHKILRRVWLYINDKIQEQNHALC
jgi:hypothetical protein